MSVNNIKICRNGRAPRTVDSHATPVSKIFLKKCEEIKKKKLYKNTVQNEVSHEHGLKFVEKMQVFPKMGLFHFLYSNFE